MDTPSFTRRQDWIQRSRRGHIPKELDLERPRCDLISASHAAASEDDVFSDGYCDGKIESWLRGCGLEAGSDHTTGHCVEHMLKTSFEDDLYLGADASVIKNGEIHSEVGPPLLPPPVRARSSRFTSSTLSHKVSQHSLDLGDSMASSCTSSSTIKTTSSVSEVLQLCSEDAEETLYQLGFGCDEPQVTARIPPRFFTFPSQVQGINFRLFLESQLERLREEDPSLSLASRFRQVEVLTAMANAFYSLYSYVSRTPLQKLTPPEFPLSASPMEKLGRFRSSIRSEPRSPVERLRDTVSKMCLYTGSREGSDSISPLASPRKRSSLTDVGGIVSEKTKISAKKLDLVECGSTLAISPTEDIYYIYGESKEEHRQKTTEDVATEKHGSRVCHKETGKTKQPDMIVSDWIILETDLEKSRADSIKTSSPLSLSRQSVQEMNHPGFFCGGIKNLVCDSTQITRPDDFIPVAKVTHDLIGPQIVESTNYALFLCSQTQRNAPSELPHICSDQSLDRSCCESQRPNKTNETLANKACGILIDISKAHQDCYRGSADPCCITVTGWEGGDVTSCPLDTSGSSSGSSTPHGKIGELPFGQWRRQYLSPLEHQNLKPITRHHQQANSFELEEVISVGEDGFAESTIANVASQNKGAAVRGDSMQSDSSGYAEEDV